MDVTSPPPLAMCPHSFQICCRMYALHLAVICLWSCTLSVRRLCICQSPKPPPCACGCASSASGGRAAWNWLALAMLRALARFLLRIGPRCGLGRSRVSSRFHRQVLVLGFCGVPELFEGFALFVLVHPPARLGDCSGCRADGEVRVLGSWQGLLQYLCHLRECRQDPGSPCGFVLGWPPPRVHGITTASWSDAALSRRATTCPRCARTPLVAT